MKIRTLLFSLSLFACTTPDPAPPPPETRGTTPSELEAAHEAYLKGDWLEMNDRLRDALVDRASSPLVKENALELLDKAYEATSGRLPSRFALPAGFQTVTLGSLRGQHQWATYRTIFLYVKLDQGLGAHVKEMSLRTQPGNVPVLDRASGIGELRLTPQPGEKADEVVLEAKNVEAALADGVAAIHVSLDDGREVDTWVLARGLSSSASPEIATPTPSATVSDASPTVEWTPFHSPEFAPFETRTLSVYVSDERTQTAAFDRWLANPGDLSRMKVDKKLGPGSYWLALSAGETRDFGPIHLARTSQRGVPFSVVP
jgi:hypothetical protein